MRRNLFLLLLIITLLSCRRKEEVFTSDPSARLSFSVEEVRFDTVFAGLTYPARRIKIFNPNKQALAIDQVALQAGMSSSFSILVNGQPGPFVQDLELMGGDSLLLFVQLAISPGSQADPYLVDDVVRFVFNGKEQLLPLRAVVIDALLIPEGDLSCASTWDDQTPVVLMGNVKVPLACTLTVTEGTKIFAVNGAGLEVYGTLLVEGSPTAPVSFRSQASGNVAGQWSGIRFYNGSQSNKLSWFSIKNAVSAMSYEMTTTPGGLVDIVLDHGLFAHFTQSALDFSHVELNASNCLFFSSAGALSSFSRAGIYSFRHCTWAGYSFNYFREGPCVNIHNVTGSLTLNLNHCIVWGDKSTEFISAAGASITADSSIVRNTINLPGTDVLWNQNPEFVQAVSSNFQLNNTSPAIDVGAPSFVTDDLKGISRDATPDWGCYEYQP